MKPRAVLFDVDGTIVPLELVVKTVESTCKHFGIPFVNTNEIHTALTSRKILDNAIGYKITEILQNLIPEAMSFEKEFGEFYEKDQITNFKKYVKMLPHVLRAFNKIERSGMKIGIVTTKKRSEALAIMKGYKLPFDTIVGGDDVKERKPHPEPIILACKRLRVLPSQCIFIGDHPFDMMASRSAGCTGIGVLTGWGDKNCLKKSGATYVIKNLGFLAKLLEKL